MGFLPLHSHGTAPAPIVATHHGYQPTFLTRLGVHPVHENMNNTIKKRKKPTSLTNAPLCHGVDIPSKDVAPKFVQPTFLTPVGVHCAPLDSQLLFILDMVNFILGQRQTNDLAIGSYQHAPRSFGFLCQQTLDLLILLDLSWKSRQQSPFCFLASTHLVLQNLAIATISQCNEQHYLVACHMHWFEHSLWDWLMHNVQLLLEWMILVKCITHCQCSIKILSLHP